MLVSLTKYMSKITRQAPPHICIKYMPNMPREMSQTHYISMFMLLLVFFSMASHFIVLTHLMTPLSLFPREGEKKNAPQPITTTIMPVCL